MVFVDDSCSSQKSRRPSAIFAFVLGLPAGGGGGGPSGGGGGGGGGPWARAPAAEAARKASAREKRVFMMLEPSSVVWVTRIQGTDDRIGARRRDGARECGAGRPRPRAERGLRAGLRSAGPAGARPGRDALHSERLRAAVRAGAVPPTANHGAAEHRAAGPCADLRRADAPAGAPAARRPSDGRRVDREARARTAGVRGPDRLGGGPAMANAAESRAANRTANRGASRGEPRRLPAASADLRGRAGVRSAATRAQALRALRSDRTGSVARAGPCPGHAGRRHGAPARRRTARRSGRRTRT